MATKTADSKVKPTGYRELVKRAEAAGLPADAVKIGQTIVDQFAALLKAGKRPEISASTIVRKYMLMVLWTVGVAAGPKGGPSNADGVRKVKAAQLVSGDALGGSIDFSGMASENYEKRRQYMGKALANEYIARMQADGLYRLVPLGKAAKLAKADTTVKSSKQPAAPASVGASNLSKVVKHACGGIGVLGTTCKQCKQTIDKGSAFDRATGKPLQPARKARKARDPERSNGKVQVSKPATPQDADIEASKAETAAKLAALADIAASN